MTRFLDAVKIEPIVVLGARDKPDYFGVKTLAGRRIPRSQHDVARSRHAKRRIEVGHGKAHIKPSPERLVKWRLTQPCSSAGSPQREVYHTAPYTRACSRSYRESAQLRCWCWSRYTRRRSGTTRTSTEIAPRRAIATFLALVCGRCPLPDALGALRVASAAHLGRTGQAVRYLLYLSAQLDKSDVIL
jgi:hypothetical protein